MADDHDQQHTAQQTASHAPARPSYVLRGHASAIHSVQILQRNTHLLTGDADGWIVYWRLESKRPVAVWRAHDAAILGTGAWGSHRLITHGRDHALRVWQLDPTATPTSTNLSTLLPAEDETCHRPKPWLLHALPANTLNFCAFAFCHEQPLPASAGTSADAILVAVPARDDNTIEVYQFPEERLLHAIPRVAKTETGMVMALKLVHHNPSNHVLLLAGYEGGYTAVHVLPRTRSPSSTPARLRTVPPAPACTIYLSRPHTQPILSLDAAPDGATYYTSSADANIAAHRVPDIRLEPHDHDAAEVNSGVSASRRTDQAVPVDASQGPHVGGSPSRSGVSATASSTTDNRISSSTDFSNHDATTDTITFKKKPLTSSSGSAVENASASTLAGLSSLLATASAQPRNEQYRCSSETLQVQPAHQTVNTKHAGQQSLSVRSDGRLLVTGGWDSRVRVYSTRTLKEMAVLKWHTAGVYAVAIGAVLDDGQIDHDAHEQAEPHEGSLAKRETGLSRLQRLREREVQKRHWVAAGAKDGRVSLWEVF